MDFRNKKHLPALLGLLAGSALAGDAGGLIPIPFTLAENGFATLVIEDETGKRVRNLISETEFPAGDHIVWWDGHDDTGRARLTDNTFRIDGRPVAAGIYQVRGLVRPEIDLRYEMTPYNPGKPPWETGDRAGRWLSDHKPPATLVFVPEGAAPKREGKFTTGGQILVGSVVAEAGDGLAWLNMDGEKVWGQKWIGGVWTGAAMLARDLGGDPVPGVYAYSAAGWKGGGNDGAEPELRLAELVSEVDPGTAPRDKRFGTGEDRPLLAPRAPYQGLQPAGGKITAPEQGKRFAFPDNDSVGVAGLAVHNGLMAVSLPKMDRLLFVDARKRGIIGLAELIDPRGLAFDSDGRLLALSGGKLLRFQLPENPTDLPNPEILIDGELEDPRQIALSTDGASIYVSDRGNSHQVKVFSADGIYQRAIGKPGTPAAGPYDPLKMNYPAGVTLDSRGRLWVAEEDFYPKRISVWNSDGSLADAFYGPHLYGGGGTLDPRDPARLFYDGMQFELDRETGGSRLTAVLLRRPAKALDMDFGPMAEAELAELYRDDVLRFPVFNHQRPASPETPFDVGGHRYFTNSYTTQPTNGSAYAALWIERDGVAVPVAASALVGSWPIFKEPEFAALVPPGELERTAFWNDRNADGRMQPDEMVIGEEDSGPVTVQPDLTFITSRGKAFAPEEIGEDGIPRYDFSNGKTLVAGARLPITSGGGMILTGKDGWTMLSIPPEPFPAQAGLAGAKDGVPMWTYPSLWPGLHPSHHAPLPQHPGQIIGHTRIIGPPVTPRGGDAGELWAVNGDKGNVYVFTRDGLFVATLWKDSRKASWDAPKAVRGMLVNDFSLQQEAFYTTISQNADSGEIHLVAGFSGNVVRAEGLEKIRRLPARKIDVTAEMIADATSARLRLAADEAKPNLKPMTIRLLDQAPVVDGDLGDWGGARWAEIDHEASAALAISGDRLFAAFRTRDPHLLGNSAESFPILFKGGGGLDLMLGTDPEADPARTAPAAGDLRLLVSRIDGKTVATLYRPVVPAAIEKQPFTFTSPVRTLVFDRVEDISGKIELAAKDGRYEFSVPLSALGLKPEAGLSIRGDLGLLRGNGSRTLERVYWSNKSTAITSDVPAEAELAPHRWGAIEFR